MWNRIKVDMLIYKKTFYPINFCMCKIALASPTVEFWGRGCICWWIFISVSSRVGSYASNTIIQTHGFDHQDKPEFNYVVRPNDPSN